MAKLALLGGSKLRSRPFPGWTVTTPADREGLMRTYERGAWGAGGENNREFCRQFAAYSGVKHCLTVANGTVSIEMLMRALGIGRGDEVIVPPYTFIASISALIYAGVTPVFADIEPDTFLLSPESAEKAITPRTKAIMPVYVGGRPADLEAFEALCKKHGLYLIGDAAQAVGSAFMGRGIGNFGTAASISCQNSKNLTCGEGGIILTNDDVLFDQLSCMLAGGRNEAGQYVSLGLQTGMGEFQASMLLSQLPALDGHITRRMENAAYLDARIREMPFAYSMRPDARVTRNSYHLELVGIREEMLRGISRGRFLEALNAEGIPLVPGYLPAYDFGCVGGAYARRCVGGEINVHPDLPHAERMARHEGCWLYHSVLLGEKADMDDIADGMLKVYENLDELL